MRGGVLEKGLCSCTLDAKQVPENENQCVDFTVITIIMCDLLS